MPTTTTATLERIRALAKKGRQTPSRGHDMHARILEEIGALYGKAKGDPLADAEISVDALAEILFEQLTEDFRELTDEHRETHTAAACALLNALSSWGVLAPATYTGRCRVDEHGRLVYEPPKAPQLEEETPKATVDHRGQQLGTAVKVRPSSPPQERIEAIRYAGSLGFRIDGFDPGLTLQPVPESLGEFRAEGDAVKVVLTRESPYAIMRLHWGAHAPPWAQQLGTLDWRYPAENDEQFANAVKLAGRDLAGAMHAIQAINQRGEGATP